MHTHTDTCPAHIDGYIQYIYTYTYIHIHSIYIHTTYFLFLFSKNIYSFPPRGDRVRERNIKGKRTDKRQI